MTTCPPSQLDEVQAQLTPSALRGAVLRWRIVAVLLIVSLLPLGLLGGGAWLVFGGLLERKSLDIQQEIVRSHSASIDRYLAERRQALGLIAATHRLVELRDQDALRRIFAELDRSYEGAFVDLGVIDASGQHVAYVGPYQLGDKNYRETAWFHRVMDHGSYVSDVFLGFRGVPHCVIAVRRDEASAPWILRATINSGQFDALVRTGRLGETGDAYLVNPAGIYQTPPRHGAVLDHAPSTAPARHQGHRSVRVEVDGRETVQVTTWLNEGRWMLVVRQSAAEIRAPLRRAMSWGAAVMTVAVCLVVGTTVLATRHLAREIDHAIEQRNQLSRELIRSARLASLGELATGLAHEINNPLAIISSERTNLGDVISEVELPQDLREEARSSLDRVKRQIERCAGITSQMLRFGRKTEATPAPTDLEPRLRETERLMRKQAEVRNVAIHVETKPDLPQVVLDPTELEQVLVNLVTNSLQAMKEGGHLWISAHTEADEVVLEIRDDGAGIAQSDIDRVFQPFFTTKPVGQGTGLGLAVCYGLVRGWDGTIEAKSEVGQGTSMIIRLPTAPSIITTSTPS